MSAPYPENATPLYEIVRLCGGTTPIASNPLQAPELRPWAHDLLKACVRPDKGMPMFFVRWPAAKANQRHVAWKGVSHRCTWPEFGEHIRAEHEGAVYAKGRGPYWSPVVNTTGHRANAETKMVSALALDCDGEGEWDAIKAVLDALDVAYILHQSGGWRPGVAKWRIILPQRHGWDVRDADGQEAWNRAYGIARVVFGILADLGRKGFDPVTKAPSNAFYYGHRRSESDPVRETIYRDGLRLDLHALVRAVEPLMVPPVKPGRGTACLSAFSTPVTVAPDTVEDTIKVQRAEQVTQRAGLCPGRGGGAHHAARKMALDLWVGCALPSHLALPLFEAWTATMPQWADGEVADIAMWAEGCASKPSRKGHRPLGYLLQDLGTVKTLELDGAAIDLDAIVAEIASQTAPTTAKKGKRPTVTLEEAEKLLPKMVEDALVELREQADKGDVIKPKMVVMGVTTGVGKSRATIKGLVKQHGGTFTAPSHRLLAETHERLTQDGVGFRRAKGLLAWDGDGACDRPALVQWASDHGHTPRQTVCRECPNRGSCLAFAGREGKGSILTAPHAMVGLLHGAEELKAPVVYDELPAVLDTWTVSVDDLVAPIVARQSGDPGLVLWASARRATGYAVQAVARLAAQTWMQEAEQGQKYAIRWWGAELRGLVEKVLDGTSPPLPSGDDVPMPTAGWLHALHAAGKSLPGLLPHARTDEALTAILTCAEGWCLVADGEGVTVEHRRVRDLPPVPCIILDATATYSEDAILAAWGQDFEVEFRHLDVACTDDVVTSNHFHSRLLSRTRLKQDGKRWWKVATGVIERTLADHKGDGLRVGIITHKPAADVIRAALAGKMKTAPSIQYVLETHLDSGKVSEWKVMHWGNSRGYNDMEKVDILITLGDPLPDLGAAEVEAAVLCIEPGVHARGLAVAELSQGHGRARAVRRTSVASVTIVHAGGLQPEGPEWALIKKYDGDYGYKSPLTIGDAIQLVTGVLGAVGIGLASWVNRASVHLCNDNHKLPDGVSNTSLTYTDGEFGGIVEQVKSPLFREAVALIASCRRLPDEVAKVSPEVEPQTVRTVLCASPRGWTLYGDAEGIGHALRACQAIEQEVNIRKAQDAAAQVALEPEVTQVTLQGVSDLDGAPVTVEATWTTAPARQAPAPRATATGAVPVDLSEGLALLDGSCPRQEVHDVLQVPLCRPLGSSGRNRLSPASPTTGLERPRQGAGRTGQVPDGDGLVPGRDQLSAAVRPGRDPDLAQGQGRNVGRRLTLGWRGATPPPPRC